MSRRRVPSGQSGRAQRGMAVIAALLVVAVAAVLTAGLFQR